MDTNTVWGTLAAALQVGRYAVSLEDARQCSPGHGQPRQEPPTHPSPPSTPIRSIDTATAGTTVLINEQLMALFEKPATAKRFMDTCYSSLFCKRTHRHDVVGNPLSFQVSPRAERDQTKSPARSANSPRKAISFQDAPEPEGRRRGN